MTYFAYLDEFGHIGPYVSRQDPRHNDSPVFGLAGFVLPSEQVRGFGTWFSGRPSRQVSITRTDSTERSFAKPSSGLTNSAIVTANRLRISS